MKAMSSPGSRRYPVTVTRLPVTTHQIRRRTVAHRPGSPSEELTEHPICGSAGVRTLMPSTSV